MMQCNDSNKLKRVYEYYCDDCNELIYRVPERAMMTTEEEINKGYNVYLFDNTVYSIIGKHLCDNCLLIYKSKIEDSLTKLGFVKDPE